jgi:hypothetical protein
MRTLIHMLALAYALGLAPDVAHAGTDSAARAQQSFQEGRALYQAGRHAEALESFRASLALHPSPNSRLYVARCLRELGRWLEAYTEFALAEREAAERATREIRYLDTRDAARQGLLGLGTHLGTVRVTLVGAPDAARVRVAGREVPPEALAHPVPVLAGPVGVEVEAPGYVTVSNTLTVEAGREEALRVELRQAVPPPPLAVPELLAPRAEPGPPGPPGWARVGTWTGVGVGVAGGVGFGVLYGLARQEHQRFRQACHEQWCSRADEQARRERGLGLQRWSNVAWGVGAAGAVTGLGFYLLGRRAESSRPVLLSTDGTSLRLSGVLP